MYPIKINIPSISQLKLTDREPGRIIWIVTCCVQSGSVVKDTFPIFLRGEKLPREATNLAGGVLEPIHEHSEVHWMPGFQIVAVTNH